MIQLFNGATCVRFAKNLGLELNQVYLRGAKKSNEDGLCGIILTI